MRGTGATPRSCSVHGMDDLTLSALLRSHITLTSVQDGTALPIVDLTPRRPPLLDVVPTLEPTSQTWGSGALVLKTAATAGTQAKEKDELTEAALAFDVAAADGATVGVQANVSLQLARFGGTALVYVESLLAHAVDAEVAKGIGAKLKTAGGAAAASAGAAFDAVKGAYSPRVVVGPVSKLLALDVLELQALGLDVVADNALSDVVTFDPAGVVCFLSEMHHESVDEPGLVGERHSWARFMRVVCQPGAVAVLPAAAP